MYESKYPPSERRVFDRRRLLVPSDESTQCGAVTAPDSNEQEFNPSCNAVGPGPPNLLSFDHSLVFRCDLVLGTHFLENFSSFRGIFALHPDSATV